MERWFAVATDCAKVFLVSLSRPLRLRPAEAVVPERKEGTSISSFVLIDFKGDVDDEDGFSVSFEGDDVDILFMGETSLLDFSLSGLDEDATEYVLDLLLAGPVEDFAVLLVSPKRLFSRSSKLLIYICITGDKKDKKM